MTAVIVAASMAAGGVLKGATGAGAPVIAVSILAAVFDVRFAVAVFAWPNLLANIWQVIRYRGALGPPRLWLAFCIGGFAGAAVGSFLLVAVPADVLIAMLALVVTIYIASRIARPGWQLSRETGTRIAGPVGLLGGVFYGAVALSGPISITFVAAMRPPREEFIATMSAFFLSMGLSQMPLLFGLGVLDGTTTLLGLLATAAMFLGMGAGNWLARFIAPGRFDRLILVILGLVAVRLYWSLLV